MSHEAYKRKLWAKHLASLPKEIPDNAVDPFTRNVWSKVMGKLDAGEATEAFKQFECAFAAAYQLGYQLGWAEAKTTEEE